MKECTDVFAGIAIMVLTTKTFFWVSILANSLFFLAFIVPLIVTRYDEDSKVSCDEDYRYKALALCSWACITNLVALASLLLFTLFAKGGIPSVTGQLLYVANWVSMIFLFVVAQTLVFSEGARSCRNDSQLLSFTMQFDML